MQFRTPRHLCCCVDITIASRLIAGVGLTISVVLLTVFLNDKYADSEDNYMRSRKTALAFGLDWQHFHKSASTSVHDDPEGRMISIIVIFYATAFLIINLLLVFATIKADWHYAIPWLVCEFLGCLSKLGALIYHLNCDPYNFGRIFVAGSIVYIVVMVWWWLVVFSAAISWDGMKRNSFDINLHNLYDSPAKFARDRCTGGIRFEDSLLYNSPEPYKPNNQYAFI